MLARLFPLIPLILLTVSSSIAVGCGSSEFNGRVFQGQNMRFAVGQIPNTWRPIEVEGALLAFRDDAAEATVAVNGRCGKDGDDVPLEALTRHLFLQFTDRDIVKQEPRQLDGREALRTELAAELDGVPKHYVVYVLKKDGCVYDFLHIGAARTPHATLEKFEQFVRGFSTLSHEP